ncbi:hypothetical protein RJ641_003966 [Dillenia turbinata]|uniref:Protein transport protein SEC23 n=1 Tax=Dillenia turbinata TaxID=194707 RepID=A0AAN8VI73_9MAGN
MDIAELEAIEGLRWTWNSWPPSRLDGANLLIPLSVKCTPFPAFGVTPFATTEIISPNPTSGSANQTYPPNYSPHRARWSFSGGRKQVETLIPSALLDLGFCGPGTGTAFVFVVDGWLSGEELRAVKSELLHMIGAVAGECDGGVRDF